MAPGYGKEIREIVILESGSLARLMGMGFMYGLMEIVTKGSSENA
jgi:hypothetical protein